MNNLCRILILNYNGRDLLEKFLPSVVESAKASRYPCKVTVLDNCSTDDSVCFLKNRFPEVDVILSRENKVLSSYNPVLKNLEEDIVILLNNDIQTEKNFTDPLIDVLLEKKDAFFAASYGDRAMARIHRGLIQADISYPGYELLVEKPGFTFSAGVAAFDRKKFLELEGYDEMYLPGIYEDVDLCYRGWRRGWKGYYAPASKKFHVGGASFRKRYGEEQIQKIVFRNGILFMVKNITDPLLSAHFIFMLILRLAGAVLTGKWFLIQGFGEAMNKFSLAVQWRKTANRNHSTAKNDRALLKIINESCVPRQRKAIYFMKKFVDYLGRHPSFQKPFFGTLFYSVRLLFPLQYFLLRELINCKSVLDLGCGPHSMVPIIPSGIHTVGVELFEPYCQEALRKGRHKKYIRADIRKIEFGEKSFDAVVLLDVLEHLSKEEGEVLIEKMEKWARKKVIVFTPNGFLHQEGYDENPYMKHRSGWGCDEFRKRGYRVHGVRGFKFMKKRHGFREGEKPTWLDSMIDLTQIVTCHLPHLAFQIFCVKTRG